MVINSYYIIIDWEPYDGALSYIATIALNNSILESQLLGPEIFDYEFADLEPYNVYIIKVTAVTAVVPFVGVEILAEEITTPPAPIYEPVGASMS